MSSTTGTYNDNNDHKPEMVLNKNMRESGTPLTAASLILSYHKWGWFFDLNCNYYDRIYLSYSPSYRYESTLRNRQNAGEIVTDSNGNILESALEQQKVMEDITYIYNNVKRGGFYLLLVPVSLLLLSCMDKDWDVPYTDGTEYGNQAVTETNLVSIAQLKQKYASVIYRGDYVQFTEPTQIKGVVTGNDIESNIYNQIAIEDGTGSIIICVAQSGLCGQLQVGREIIVELQDLYIGSYGQQPEIGTPVR